MKKSGFQNLYTFDATDFFSQPFQNNEIIATYYIMVEGESQIQNIGYRIISQNSERVYLFWPP